MPVHKARGVAIVTFILQFIVSSLVPVFGFTGVQYDQGNVTEAMEEFPEEVDALADVITRSTELTLKLIESMRQRLRYGRIETESGDVAPQLVTYPAPDEIEPSNRYKVTVRHLELGTESESFVYKADARKTDTNLSVDTSWTSFSFAGPVTVAVRSLVGRPTDCIVRPQSLDASVRFSDDTCFITLREAANFSVEFEPYTQKPIPFPMLVFANPPEVDVPDPNDPDVRYFGPGVHQIGPEAPIRSGETIYVAGGAWVEGTFFGQSVQDVVIKGRGVISGRSIDTGNQDQNKNQPGLINILGSQNVLVEGITFVDAPRFNVRVLGHYVTLRNLKMISWWYSTDGLVAGSAGLIEDNFIKVNDDSIKLHWGNNIVRRNVIWQLENGGPFNISWNIHQNVADFHIYDNDVIRAEHYWLAPQAIFRSRHAGSGHMRRYLFEDIRIEDADWRLFYLILEQSHWYDPLRGFGQISDIVFRNITANRPFRNPSVVKGINDEHLLRNINFQDIRLVSGCIENRSDGWFNIDATSTDEIRIMRTSQCE